jgi:hypothetical protein
MHKKNKKKPNSSKGKAYQNPIKYATASELRNTTTATAKSILQ